jgi:sortase A
VVEGTAPGQLEEGPGHYVGTPLPGDPGNSAIAGHRTTFGAPFNRLNEVAPGDTIITTTNSGRFLYVVSGKKTVSPDDSSVIGSFGDNRLTLTTCTPEYLATQRLIVIAQLEGKAEPAVSPKVATPPTPSDRVLAESAAVTASLDDEARSGFHWPALFSASIAVGLLIGLGLLFNPVRRHLPALAAAVVLAPLWAGGLLFLFEQLIRFLPSNV